MQKVNILIVLIPFIAIGCKSQSVEEIIGVYVNSNFDYKPFVAEIPYSKDTLILYEDFTFDSGYYGKGEFEVKNNRIKLIYEYEFGTASFEAPIETDKHGKPKIILFRKRDHYYKKIE